MKRLLSVLCALSILTVCVSITHADPPPINPTPALVTHVVDGDTIDVEIDGLTYRVRYIGVNTSERGEPCYNEGTAANRYLVEGQTVYLDKDVSDIDRYARLLRYVYVGETMVNADLVRQGVAQAATYPPDVRFAGWFVELEGQARAARIGCWAGLPYLVYLPVAMRAIPPTPTPTVTPTATWTATPTMTHTPTRTSIPTATRLPTVQPTLDACCKHCGPNSQPCGDGCISLRYTCHQPTGCACW